VAKNFPLQYSPSTTASASSATAAIIKVDENINNTRSNIICRQPEFKLQSISLLNRTIGPGIAPGAGRIDHYKALLSLAIMPGPAPVQIRSPLSITLHISTSKEPYDLMGHRQVAYKYRARVS